VILTPDGCERFERIAADITNGVKLADRAGQDNLGGPKALEAAVYLRTLAAQGVVTKKDADRLREVSDEILVGVDAARDLLKFVPKIIWKTAVEAATHDAQFLRGIATITEGEP